MKLVAKARKAIPFVAAVGICLSLAFSVDISQYFKLADDINVTIDINIVNASDVINVIEVIKTNVTNVTNVIDDSSPLMLLPLEEQP